MLINKNLVSFITGGASGMGETTARMLLAHGGRVAIADMNAKRLAKLKEELGQGLITFECNVTDEMQVKKAMEKTAEEFGALHFAFASAGTGMPTPFLKNGEPLNTELFQRVININLMGSVYVAKYAAQIMAKNEPVNKYGDRGLITFVSSIMARYGTADITAYSASKGALEGLTLPLARDLAPYKIRVVSIAPGWVNTNMTAAMGG